MIITPAEPVFNLTVNSKEMTVLAQALIKFVNLLSGDPEQLHIAKIMYGQIIPFEQRGDICGK